MIAEAKQQNSINAFLKLSHYSIPVPNIEKQKEAQKPKKKGQKESDSDSESEGEGDSSDSEEDPKKPAKTEQPVSAISNTKSRVLRMRESIVLSLCLKVII
jgi:hypothetical protein